MLVREWVSLIYLTEPHDQPHLATQSNNHLYDTQPLSPPASQPAASIYPTYNIVPAPYSESIHSGTVRQRVKKCPFLRSVSTQIPYQTILVIFSSSRKKKFTSPVEVFAKIFAKLITAYWQVTEKEWIVNCTKLSVKIQCKNPNKIQWLISSDNQRKFIQIMWCWNSSRETVQWKIGSEFSQYFSNQIYCTNHV